MDRRQDIRYKQQNDNNHSYETSNYRANFQSYNYERDYGNQYENSGHYQRHGYEEEDEESHWQNQGDQNDYYDSVPVTKSKNIVQITTDSNSTIPQAPPPPRFGGGPQYSRNGGARKENALRFETQEMIAPSQTGIIDGYRTEEIYQAKKKDPHQPTNAIRSIINNLKGINNGGNAGGQKNEIPQNRVSTNPFMRANQQEKLANQPKTPCNVADVVEKLNNGDWPIQIEEESGNEHNQKRVFSGAEKARQWETLHRKKEEKPSILDANLNNFAGRRTPVEETDKMSDRSHEEEQTSVSTDSAIVSENPRVISPYKLPFDSENRDESVDEEARKLMIYFKKHQDVLNYLGIGLSQRLWLYIETLPSQDIEMKVLKKNPSQKLVEVERPAKTEISQENVYPKNRVENDYKDRQSAGRFVKKSAAALIAKKQGFVSEDPNSATDIIDPRIAEEIKNLRDREEELRQCRHRSKSPCDHENNYKNLKNSNSYDRLDSHNEMMPIERSQSSHNVCIKSPRGPPTPQQNHHIGSMPRKHQRQESQYSHVNSHYRRNTTAINETPHTKSSPPNHHTNTPEFFRGDQSSFEASPDADWSKQVPSIHSKSMESAYSGLGNAKISISGQARSSDNKPPHHSKSHYGKLEHNRKMGGHI